MFELVHGRSSRRVIIHDRGIWKLGEYLCDMRLSIACAATDAEFQNRINLHDNTLNLHAMARRPHPDPNYAPYTAARLLAVA